MNTANVPPKAPVPAVAGPDMPPTIAADCEPLGHTPIRGWEYRPQRPLFTDEEAEIEFHARTAFTAWEFALYRKGHHPRLWRAIQGSPFELLYRLQFNPA